MRIAPVLATVSLVLAAGCSDDGKPAAISTTSAAGATPTLCETIPDDDLQVVTIDVDDDSDGFGRFGLRTPSPLGAGVVRVALNSVEDNPNPITVTVSSAGGVVFQFDQVEAGVVCATTLDLVAGDYTVTFGDSSKTFTVTE